MCQARKETEEATARGGGAGAAAPGAEPADEKPLIIKREEPDPEVSLYISVSDIVIIKESLLLTFFIYFRDIFLWFCNEVIICVLNQLGEAEGANCTAAAKEHARAKIQEQDQIIKDLKQQLK